MKLSIIIVNYNVRHFLEQALLSIRQARFDEAMEVFVVDNNSVDDSVLMVQEKFPEVRLVANRSNPGFSIANNQAIRRSSGEYVLLLNPDTVVEEDTFEKCVRFMDGHPEAGALGVRMIDGSGKFLPESKRGFPSPFVAFCKTVGLSRLFPRSRTFNHYHLGYLDEGGIHEVEVLAGAFMMLRRSVLDEVGLLDEQFFMYGEDIDLSYRIVKAGYKNYYFPSTTIIHYKGESTKKGSLNYVRAFYKAMIIFARKHFEGEKARLFIFMLQIAIYLKASITLLGNFFKRIYLPLLDAIAIYLGMYLLKEVWSTHYFKVSNYYPPSFMYFNVSAYAFIWLISVYFSGGYDDRSSLRRLARGLMMGTILLAAFYGFLEPEYRTSRALILLGAVWTMLSTALIRLALHFASTGNFNLGRDKTSNLVIAGTQEESERVVQLLMQAQIQKNIIGTVSPSTINDPKTYLSNMDQLDEVVQIYKVDEVIFCSRDISSQNIMQWMTRLGSEIQYKIVPDESLSIIGSSSKNTSGELYTIDIRFRIAEPLNRRNKRLFDIFTAFVLLLLLPLAIGLVAQKGGFLRNLAAVFAGRRSWVGYAPHAGPAQSLPPLKTGILTPADALPVHHANEHTLRRINFLYAKDYSLYDDLNIIWKGIRRLRS